MGVEFGGGVGEAEERDFGVDGRREGAGVKDGNNCGEVESWGLGGAIGALGLFAKGINAK